MRLLRSPRQLLSALVLACAAQASPAQTAAEAQIVIGQIVSRAPGLADTGREIAVGADACVMWVNAAGGVRGRSLRLVSGDDGGDPATLLPRAREMLANNAIAALLTPMGRSGNERVLPWAAQEGLAVIAPYGAGALSAQAATLSSTFFLRTHPSVEALRLTTQLESLGIDRIAVIYSDDELGRETLAAFEEAIASTGKAATALIPLRDTDAQAAVQALDRSAAQAVLLATLGQQTQSVLRGLNQRPRDARRIVAYGLSSVASQHELRALGPAARGLVVSQVLPSPGAGALPLMKNYRAALRGAGDPAPSYPSLEGCAAVLTLAQVLRKSNEALTRVGVLKALRGAGVVDLGGWSVDLADRQRPGSRFTDITLVGADGSWVR